MNNNLQNTKSIINDKIRDYHSKKSSILNVIVPDYEKDKNIAFLSENISAISGNITLDDGDYKDLMDNNNTTSALLSKHFSTDAKMELTEKSSGNSLLLQSIGAEGMDEDIHNAILIIIYTVIIIVSIFGNSVVLKIMLSKNTPRTATNLLIVNLAFSDLLLTCFNIPVNIVRFVARDWPFGQQICTLTPFIQSLSAHCSAITMMVIALERYNRIVGGTICQSLKQKLFQLCCCRCRRLSLLETRLPSGEPEMATTSKIYSAKHRSSGSLQSGSQSSHLILLIWSSAALLAMPSGIGNEVNTFKLFDLGVPNMIRCTNQQNSTFRLILAFTIPVSQYLLPIGITTVVYLRIGHFLWMRRDPIGSCSVNKREILLRRRRNRIKMLAIVVGVFAVCWLPLHIYVSLVEFKVIPHNMTIYFITHWFAMSSVCYNPFIYCWLNENFRSKTNTILSLASLIGACVTRSCRIDRQAQALATETASGGLITGTSSTSSPRKHQSDASTSNSAATKSSVIPGGLNTNGKLRFLSETPSTSPEIESKFDIKIHVEDPLSSSPHRTSPLLLSPPSNHNTSINSLPNSPSFVDSNTTQNAKSITDSVVILSNIDSAPSIRKSSLLKCNTTTIAVNHSDTSPNSAHGLLSHSALHNEQTNSF